MNAVLSLRELRSVKARSYYPTASLGLEKYVLAYLLTISRLYNVTIRPIRKTRPTVPLQVLY